MNRYGLKLAIGKNLIWIKQTKPKNSCEYLEGLYSIVEFEEARRCRDYLYSAKKLIELKGNHFHKKKNLFSQSIKSYNISNNTQSKNKGINERKTYIKYCK